MRHFLVVTVLSLAALSSCDRLKHPSQPPTPMTSVPSQTPATVPPHGAPPTRDSMNILSDIERKQASKAPASDVTR